MQLVNRGHRSSSTVSADGHQLPSAAATATDIALMRWSSRGFTAIPVEPDDAGSTTTSSTSTTVGSLVGPSRNGSTSVGGGGGGGVASPTAGGATRGIEYLTLDTATADQCGGGGVSSGTCNRWGCWVTSLTGGTHRKGQRQRSKQQRHGKGGPSSATASTQPPSSNASSSCLRDCLLCRCCRSGQYALSFGRDQTFTSIRRRRGRSVGDRVVKSNMDEQKEASDQEEGNYECK
uniref:Uncharacterized protein n=1 Tax=Anopheles farauti TaxID=69004 RepID=A0A182QFQ1_9DIPT